MIWIWIFSVFYVVGSWMLWTLMPGEPDLLRAMILFGIGLIGMEFATIFTNSLMPDLTGDAEMGKVSGSGFAFGYVGGIVALVIMLLFFAESGATGKTLIGLDPLFGLDAATREGTRAVGPLTAVWYIVFMIPFFAWVREPKGPARKFSFAAAMVDLWQLLKSLKAAAKPCGLPRRSMFYRDALNALYGFGGVYASGVLGWSVTKIGIFGIVGAISGALFAWLGGKMDSACGPKPVIKIAMIVLIAVCLVIAGMSRDALLRHALRGRLGAAGLYLLRLRHPDRRGRRCDPGGEPDDDGASTPRRNARPRPSGSTRCPARPRPSSRRSPSRLFTTISGSQQIGISCR